MDGTNITTLHDTSLSNPIGLTIDYCGQILYWCDNGYDRIESSNTDGSNRQTLTNYPLNPFSVAFFEDSVYWSDTSYDRIYSYSISSSNITAVSDYIYNPYGLRTVSHYSQPYGTSLNMHACFNVIHNYSQNIYTM